MAAPALLVLVRGSRDARRAQVGCVLVAADGETIAEGFHAVAGAPHAEAMALAAAARSRPARRVRSLEECARRRAYYPFKRAAWRDSRRARRRARAAVLALRPHAAVLGTLIAARVARVVAAASTRTRASPGAGFVGSRTRASRSRSRRAATAARPTPRALNAAFFFRCTHDGRPLSVLRCRARAAGRVRGRGRGRAHARRAPSGGLTPAATADRPRQGQRRRAAAAAASWPPLPPATDAVVVRLGRAHCGGSAAATVSSASGARASPDRAQAAARAAPRCSCRALVRIVLVDGPGQLAASSPLLSPRGGAPLAAGEPAPSTVVIALSEAGVPATSRPRSPPPPAPRADAAAAMAPLGAPAFVRVVALDAGGGGGGDSTGSGGSAAGAQRRAARRARDVAGARGWA